MGRIRDRALRASLLAHVAAEEAAGRTSKQARGSFRWPRGTDRRVRHVRLLKKEAKYLSIDGPSGEAYKALIPGDNHHIDIYEVPSGKWDGEGVSVFDANRPDFAPEWPRKHPGARLVMRVHKGDLLKMEYEGVDQVMRVYALEPSAKRFRLIAHNQAGNPDLRHSDESDPFSRALISFSKLNGRRARKVSVDVLGRVRDPGPPT